MAALTKPIIAWNYRLNPMPMRNSTVLALSLLCASVFAGLLSASEEMPVSKNRTNYHGWPNSWVLSNGQVEAVVVPAIGRVMQFRFVGEEDGPLWENRPLDGKRPDPKAAEWGNFGGDKTWPAPQEDWPKVTKRAWPPPPAFDSMPVEVKTAGVGLTLISPVDRFYGIRTERLVMLDASKPEMMIATTYEKVAGPPRKVAIWTITQLKDPVGVFLAPHPLSPWPGGYNKQSETLPANFTIQDHMLSLSRDPKEAHKIGAQSSFLLWVGQKWALRIFNARLPNTDYPDQGSNAEVYTNPNPLTYVELEMLGPLHEMRVGDKIRETRSYTLIRREKADAQVDARRILGL